MKNIFTLVLALGSYCANAQYELVWSDEFDGTSLDLTKWTYDLGAGGWGNEEPQYYTANESNVDVDTGYLRITAIEEDFGGATYTSARIKTKDLYEFKYGKVEARIKIPKGQGLWPAFWMLGANIDDVSWPKCGEIDIMEHVNHSFYIHGTYHYDNWGHTYSGEDKAVDVEEFQVYAIEWDESKIKWFVNDELYFTANIEGGVASTEEFHEPFFLLLNMATGGLWPGYPDDSDDFPADMFVDYVRVYQETSNIEELSDKHPIYLYPNPANDIVKITGIAEKNDLNYSVSSLSGEVVLNGALDYNHELTVSGLTEGCYIFELKDTEGTVQRRLRLMVQ